MGDQGDDLSSRVTEGTTRFSLTRIPHFREVLLESFSCDHCGNKNTSVKSAGEIQELGSKYTFKIETEKDLERQIIRNDTGVFRLEDIDLEMPSGQSSVTNIEGMLAKIYGEVDLSQSARRDEDPALYTALKGLLDKIECWQNGLRLPFTITLNDPSGNSFVEPSPTDSGGKYQRSEYKRTHAQNVALGLASEAVDGTDELANDLENLDIIDNKQYTIPAECPGCAKDCEVNITKTNIPHFKECIIMATVCEHCGYRTNDIKTGGEIPEKGRRTTVSIEKPEDLSRDILKSESCTLHSEELNLEVYPGTLGGRFTTVEGLLSQIRDHLYGQIFDVPFDSEAVDSGSVDAGDSMAIDMKQKWLDFFSKLEKARKAEMSFKIKLVDPLANSYVQSLAADADVEKDPQITVEEYERTEDEIDELGLNDMKTEGYEQDARDGEEFEVIEEAA
ncbi:MAG: hypothetical protein Q9227_006096 [Pyrenula ochraceoflavens]